MLGGGGYIIETSKIINLALKKERITQLELGGSILWV